jgi:hypothetical protein
MGPEAKIQKTTVTWAKATYRKDQLLPRKFQSGMYGTNGYPDYDWLVKGGKIFFIEFKAPGADCTELQLARHSELRALGFTVYVCDSVDQAKGCIRTEMRKALGRAA